MSSKIYPKKFNLIRLFNIPFEMQIIILEFLNYKYRIGVFIKQIPRNLRINDLLLDRLERRNIIYFKNNIILSFDIDFRDYHNDYVVKTMEIAFSKKDRSIFTKINNYYAIDYTGIRYNYEPSIPW